MDRAIQRTDDDALQSKAAAAIKGYFSDEFLPRFCTKPPPARLPLINIGTYCRVLGVSKLIDQFLARTKQAKRRIVVSLGAGSDTRAFHILRDCSNVEYYELDFPVKTAKKLQIISASPEIRQIVNNSTYHLIGVDLRKIEGCEPLLKLQVDPAPTLLLSECCLCYLDPVKSDNVLHYFNKLVPKSLLSVVLYEPISLKDEFGRIMAENLAMRGLSLPTIDLYCTLESQIKRLRTIIGGKAEAVDIDTVYTKWITPEDATRISRLEFLDEVEEMHLLMRHYCIAWTFPE